MSILVLCVSSLLKREDEFLKETGVGFCVLHYSDAIVSWLESSTKSNNVIGTVLFLPIVNVIYVKASNLLLNF